MTDAFIYDAVRSPRGKGRADGSLHELSSVALSAKILNAIKDRNGQTLIEPTTTERIVKFIGYNPDRLSKVRKQREMYRFADETSERENQQATNERIELLNKGDFPKVLQSIQAELGPQVAAWKAQGLGSMEITKLIEKETRAQALKLVNAAVQKNIPVDPLAGGNTASAGRRRAIAASFGNNQAPREVSAQQQQLAARLLQGLGQAAVQRSPRSIRISNLAAKLIEADPTLTDQDAQFIAEQQIR